MASVRETVERYDSSDDSGSEKEMKQPSKSVKVGLTQGSGQQLSVGASSGGTGVECEEDRRHLAVSSSAAAASASSSAAAEKDSEPTRTPTDADSEVYSEDDFVAEEEDTVVVDEIDEEQRRAGANAARNASLPAAGIDAAKATMVEDDTLSVADEASEAGDDHASQASLRDESPHVEEAPVAATTVQQASEADDDLASQTSLRVEELPLAGEGSEAAPAVAKTMQKEEAPAPVSMQEAEEEDTVVVDEIDEEQRGAGSTAARDASLPAASVDAAKATMVEDDTLSVADEVSEAGDDRASQASLREELPRVEEAPVAATTMQQASKADDDLARQTSLQVQELPLAGGGSEAAPAVAKTVQKEEAPAPVTMQQDDRSGVSSSRSRSPAQQDDRSGVSSSRSRSPAQQDDRSEVSSSRSRSPAQQDSHSSSSPSRSRSAEHRPEERRSRTCSSRSRSRSPIRSEERYSDSEEESYTDNDVLSGGREEQPSQVASADAQMPLPRAEQQQQPEEDAAVSIAAAVAITPAVAAAGAAVVDEQQQAANEELSPRAELKNKDAEQQQLGEELHSMRRQMEGLRQKLAQNHRELEKSGEQLEQARAELARLQHEKDSASRRGGPAASPGQSRPEREAFRQVEKLIKERQTLQAQLKSMQDQVAKMEKLKSNLEQRLRLAERERDAAKRRLQQAEHPGGRGGGGGGGGASPRAAAPAATPTAAPAAAPAAAPISASPKEQRRQQQASPGRQVREQQRPSPQQPRERLGAPPPVRRPPVQPPPPAPGPGEQVWRFQPRSRAALAIRILPSIDAPKSGEKMYPGDAFLVSEKQRGIDAASAAELLFLRLADGRGWVFNRSPDVGTLCIESDAPKAAVDNLAPYRYSDKSPPRKRGGDGISLPRIRQPRMMPIPSPVRECRKPWH
eukprot:TRINITY_DN4756_c0_g1_i1.p1 TRINITY_DN4756_c0_g1~~TRINITY_DN4756_c0_g1_i1.p1  ORF type:complete len:913 (+),score=268.46 TRINITY_DN4756_c0_g1_i1:114-2852(+)